MRRSRSSSVLSISSVVALALVAPACDETPESLSFGSMAITTRAPAAAAPHTTADGWSVSFQRMLVHVTAVNVAGDDAVLAASAGPLLVDPTGSEPRSLLSSKLRMARAWQDVNFQIGPASADAEATVLPPATDADLAMMVEKGLSIHVEGKATKGDVTKSFRWGFTTDTRYSECQADRGGAVVRGLVVPADGNDAAEVVMDPTVLFSNDLAGTGELRAEEIGAADADADGVVTLDELRAAPLDAARQASVADAESPPTDLGGFVEALARRIVRSFRESGTCVATPSAPETPAE